MVIGILKEWNPWWENKELVTELEGRTRPVYNDLLDSVNMKEITIITGVRRSGKSTLMYQMIDRLLNKYEPEQIFFINLEDKKLSKYSLEDIYKGYRENINPGKKAFIFLDEVHKKEGWESWIRKKYDLRTKDKFVISGSCSYLLKKEYSTLLTGRNLAFEVYPLSFREFLAFKGIEANNTKVILEGTKYSILKNLKQYLELGGFPEVFFKPERFKAKLLGQYFDDILYKDIIDRYSLNSQKAKDLALFFMTNFTGIVSLRKIRGSLGLSYDSIKDYLSYFKEAFLFFVLDHFSYSFKEQKSTASKVYCIDNGLRNAVSFKFSRDMGRLAENAVFIELKRREEDVYYWTDRGEVDFIVKKRDNSLAAINVSYTDKVEEREIASLLDFKKDFKKAKELVIITKDTEKKEKGITFIPLWKWLLG